jgi:hypothetical protein
MKNDKVLKNLRNYFIPNAENEFQPKILKPKAAIFIFLLIIIIENLFFLISYSFIPYSEFLANLIGQTIADLTNSSRLNYNILPLKINPLLSQAAQLKAEDMAQKGYFNHVSPDNITPWYWLDRVGYKYISAGENLAINFTDSEEVVKAWLNSETHRQNILNQNFTEIGIGIAKGTYQDKPAIFIVQMFGTPEISYVSQNSIPSSNNYPVSSPMANQKPSSLPSAPLKTKPLQSINPSLVPTIAPTTITNPNNLNIDKNSSVKSEMVINNKIANISLFQKIITNPLETTNNILKIFAILIIVSLIFKIFIQIKMQFPLLIINGALLLMIIFSALWVNDYLSGIWAKII